MWSKDNLPPSVKDKNWSDAQIEAFVVITNALQAQGTPEAEAIAKGDAIADEKRNASQFPQIYYARHMQPGVAKYEKETILVDTDAMKRMLPSAIGKPVYVLHQKVDLANLKETAGGYITDSFYNELDGWAWFKFIVIDDTMRNAIAQDWSVSNAYRPTQKGQPGTKINVSYDWELLNAEFTHLAIVPDPRYEGADVLTPDEFKIYQETKKKELEELHNSKTPSKGKTMFNLFKNSKEKVTTIDGDTMVELDNGLSVSIEEMVNAVKKNAEDDDAAKKKKEDEEKKNSDPMVKCNGEEMPLSELVNKYSKLNEKKNAEGEEDEEKKKKAEDEKKNAKAAETEEEMRNRITKEIEGKQHFSELANARDKVQPLSVNVETGMDKVARGNARYGSAALKK